MSFVYVALGEYRGQLRADLVFRYIGARFTESEIEKSYRVYMTEAVRMIAKGGEYPSVQWIDLVDPKPPIDAEAITDDVINGAGLVAL